MDSVKSSKRNVNIEILRIVSIFIIIFNHYSIYGGFEFENPLSFNAFMIEFLHLGGKIGVDIFIFISGWFMSRSKKFDIKRIVRLCLQVLFYSIILAAAGRFLGTLSNSDTVRMLLAIPAGNWIFITSYFMLSCLSPVLNIIINNISKRQYFSLLAFLAFTWICVPTILPIDFDMSNTSWYIYIYMLAGFLRKYEDDIPKKPKMWFTIGIASLLIIILSEIVLEVMGVHVAAVFGEHAEHFRNMNSIFVVINVVGIFLGVSQLKPRTSDIIPKIASTSLAVFVLHDNRALRPLIWTDWFRTTKFNDSPFLVVHALLTAIVIFIIGMTIDLIRQATIEKLTLKFVFPIVDKIEKSYNRFLSNKVERREAENE